MRRIAIYPDGSAAVIETEGTSHSVTVNGQEAVELHPVTEETMARYFGSLEKPEIEVK